MNQPLSLSTDGNGLLSGFRYHDGRIVHIGFDRDAVTLRVACEDGLAETDLLLTGVRAYRQDGLLSQSIVGWMFVVKSGELSAEKAATLFGRDIDLYKSLEPGELIIQVEAIMGVGVTAVCTAVTAWAA